MTIKENKVKGFTLLELLIVIAILAILSVALVLILNPAETLRKSRDSQRMSDLARMKTAIGLYMTTVTPANLTNDTTVNNRCINGAGTDSVFYSIAGITDTGVNGAIVPVSSPGASVNGSGWLPVDFTKISGGSPISNLPVDPSNTVSVPAAIANADLVYRYVCDADDSTFEINAALESDELASNLTADGGDNANLYEVGTKLSILGDGADF